MKRNPRNVLFITVDQWRADCLSCLKHPTVKTPNLDRLAADGLLFTRHFSQAVPCAPARASLYTGLYLHNHRLVVNGCPMDSRHTNVAREARKLGYEPALFGYTDIGADPRDFAPGDPALRRYEGILPGMEAIVPMDEDLRPWRAHLLSKNYDVPETPHDVFLPDRSEAASQGPHHAPARYRAEDSSTAFLTDEVIKYLSVRKGEPWFVHLSIWSPHPPFVVPAPYHALYDPQGIAPPQRARSVEEEAAQHPFLAHYLYNQEGMSLRRENATEDRLFMDGDELKRLKASYYGMMSEVDDQIGRLISYLKSEFLYDKTLIVITSDHGEMLGDHWMFAKYGWFDQAFAVPLIIRDPEAEGSRGARVESFSEHVDIMPTILEWLGGEAPPQIDGRSLLPFLRGAPPEKWRDAAHWGYDFRDLSEKRDEAVLGLSPEESNLACLRDARYKYVHFAALPAVFYDLEQDPGETTNLAEDPAYRELVLTYAQKLLSWRLSSEEKHLTHLRLTPSGLVDKRREA